MMVMMMIVVVVVELVMMTMMMENDGKYCSAVVHGRRRISLPSKIHTHRVHTIGSDFVRQKSVYFTVDKM